MHPNGQMQLLLIVQAGNCQQVHQLDSRRKMHWACFISAGAPAVPIHSGHQRQGSNCVLEMKCLRCHTQDGSHALDVSRRHF